jgi:putative DNA primase/helicase
MEKDNKDATKRGKPDLSATGIVRLATERLTLFHTPGREAFASICVKDHRETYRVKSPVFEEWLSAMCYHQYGVAPSQNAIAAARSALAGDALFASVEKQVYVRVAGHDEAIYVDLANDSWESVKITGEGWEVVPHTPVRFWRPPGMQALQRPKKGDRFQPCAHF